MYTHMPRLVLLAENTHGKHTEICETCSELRHRIQNWANIVFNRDIIEQLLTDSKRTTVFAGL